MREFSRTVFAVSHIYNTLRCPFCHRRLAWHGAAEVGQWSCVSPELWRGALSAGHESVRTNTVQTPPSTTDACLKGRPIKPVWLSGQRIAVMTLLTPGFCWSNSL